jgi:RimJ/RimL family protein N-acetyltransferase
MIDFKVNFENDSIALIQTEIFHFEKLYLIASNPIIWEQHPENDRWRKDKFKEFFKSAIENELGCFSIFDKKYDKIVGSTRFYSYEKNDKAVSIGYTFISPEYWGTSTNSQIKKMMLDYTFIYLDKVYFDIGEQNFRSRKAIEKLGAKLLKDGGNGMIVYLLEKNIYDKLYNNQKPCPS